MTTPAQGLAVIDGALCLFGEFGRRSVAQAPLATAIVEFRRGPLCTFVREHPFGLLPGVANLYCLDGDNRLKWMAEWPATDDFCASIVDERDGVLTVTSMSGATVELNADTGALLRWQAKARATA